MANRCRNGVEGRLPEEGSGGHTLFVLTCLFADRNRPGFQMAPAPRLPGSCLAPGRRSRCTHAIYGPAPYPRSCIWGSGFQGKPHLSSGNKTWGGGLKDWLRWRSQVLKTAVFTEACASNESAGRTPALRGVRQEPAVTPGDAPHADSAPLFLIPFFSELLLDL